MLEYHHAPFSQGRMDFAWEELSAEERQQAYADWEAGRGLIGGDPRLRPGSALLPTWGLNRPYFRTLALDDARGDNGPRLRAALTGAAPLEIEIGYGRGDFLLDRAARFPDTLFIGYETKIKATRLCLGRVERFGLGNVRLSDDDARFSLPRLVADGRAEMVHLLFPDPWWKTTYKARRLMSPPFMDLLARLLRPGGIFHFRSDVEEYAELVAYLVEQHPAFARHDPALRDRIGEHAPTHRENWCRRHGKPVFTRLFARVSDQFPVTSFQ